MNPSVLGVLIPIVAIVGGITLAIVKVLAATRVRELQIRERIAMIEKGLVPSPEKDPNGFESAMSRYDQYRVLSRAGAAGRHRRAGIVLMGAGVGLTLLIGLAGNESLSTAIGIGGFIAALGAAFLLNSVLEARDDPRPSPSQIPPANPQGPPAGS
jgi:hypothetical protein